MNEIIIIKQLSRTNIVCLLVAVLLLSTIPAATSAKEITDEKSDAIQSFLDETCRISGVPGMAVSVRVGENVHNFSSGYADREKSLTAHEDTLFELASVSKAFTAFGILLLEERGLLSMNDPIQKYLPWFTLQYKGEPVDMDGVTLNHFMHHTSGLVNSKHNSMIPRGDGADMLRKTVETFIDAELAFAPGERYTYGTMNYDVLGQVIAVVSGQSYEAFLQTEVLDPLGLHETYMYGHEAQLTGRMAKGHVSSFLLAFPVESPKYEGNKPAGYIISCAKDMLRWADIQMGLIEDIPDIYKAVVEKSHYADMSVSGTSSMHYAAGWEVDVEGTYIGHSGNNPNFATDVKLYSEEQIAIILLTNSNQTNNGIYPTLADNIKGMLDDELHQKYMLGIFQILDIIAVGMTIAGLLLTILFLALGLHRWKNRTRNPIPKKRVVLTAVWMVITVATILLGIFFPTLMGESWKTALELCSYSFLTGSVALVLASASTTWFVFARR